VLARTTNLNKHLKTHDLLDEWFKEYETYKQPKKTVIDDTNLKLIKYFISSNVALKELKNKWLRELINVEVLPGPHSFR
jgi:predicted nucleotidyltransferase